MKEVDKRASTVEALTADTMPAGIYTKQEYSGASALYVILPQHKVAIPYCKETKTLSILIEQLVDHGDMKSSQMMADYPIVTHNQLEMWYIDYEIVAVLRNIEVYKPAKALSGWEIRRRQDKVDKHRGHTKLINKINETRANPFWQSLSEDKQKQFRSSL